MATSSDTLLGSGTNELEIIMFQLGNETFGINVLKVREIINPLTLTRIPNSHPNVERVIQLREEDLPVVNFRFF